MFRLPKVFLTGVLATCATGVVSASPPLQSFVAPSLVQAPLAAQPTDVSVTPDGDYALVRSTAPPAGSGTSQVADHLSVWDMNTRTRVGLTPILGVTPGQGEFTVGDEVSDLVDVSQNDRALCAGSGAIGGPNQDTTFIDVIAFPANVTSNAVVLSSLTFSVAAGTTTVAAGRVNDVAVTPNGKVGVVNHHNQVHFINMRTGAVFGMFDLSRLGMPPPSAGEVSPMGATDSIAVSNGLVAVITTRFPGVVNQSMPWIFLFNISGGTGVPPVNTYASAFALPIENFTSVARSVRFTPDLNQVVMTADFIVASLPLHLPQASPPPHHTILTEDRAYAPLRDSLEVSNKRAVTLSQIPSGNFHAARIHVFSLEDPTGLQLRNPIDITNSPSDDRAHDLALTPDGLMAVVKTEHFNIVVSGLFVGPQGPSAAYATSTGNPLAILTTFVSDSVLISADGSTGITAGTAKLAGPQQKNTTVLDFIQLTPSGTAATVILSDLNRDLDFADLKLTRDGSRVIIRSKHQTGLTPGSTGGQSISIFGLDASPMGTLAADGDVFRLDDIEVGEHPAISISETKSLNPPSLAAGFVQLIHF